MTILNWEGGGSSFVPDDVLGYNLRAREKHRAAHVRLRRLLHPMTIGGKKAWGCKTRGVWRRAQHHARQSDHWFDEMQRIVPHMKEMEPRP